MKKKYMKPTMEIYELNQPTRLLVGSGDDYWGQLPTVPGQPEDEKHLA